MAALSTLALGAMAVGTGISIYGQQQAAKTAQKAAEFNAGQNDANARETAAAAEYNASLLENQALQAEMDSRETIRRRRMESKRYAETQRARFAASGVTEAGSPLETMAETAALLEMDAQEVNRQAQVRTAQLRAGARETRRTGFFQAGQYTAQAGFERQYGAAQKKAANISSFGTLLQGASSLALTKANFNYMGVK